MTRIASAVLVAAAVAFVSPAVAGEFNKKLNIGDSAPTYKALEGVDGKKHTLSDLKDKEVIVVAITCNHCPVAVAYEDRIIEFAKKHCGEESKVGLVAINVNNNEADKLPKMVERAKEKGFPFAYIYDPSQQIGKELGATRTPEFFVLDKERKVIYMGAFDDNQNNPKVNYVEAAVTAALAGKQPEVKETRPRGCGVQYER